MNDTVWQAIRYVLIGGGMFLAGRGKVDPTQVATFADEFITIAAGAVSALTAAWGFFVKWRTKAVPEKTAARPDVPTVSAATGAVTN